jgi:hypothetical protein
MRKEDLNIISNAPIVERKFTPQKRKGSFVLLNVLMNIIGKIKSGEGIVIPSQKSRESSRVML